MKHIFACACGCEEECEPEVFSPGYVYQCPDCKRIWGCVLMRMGPMVWIPIEPQLAEFHRLLEEPKEEDENSQV
jgi:hypothetical protein